MYTVVQVCQQDMCILGSTTTELTLVVDGGWSSWVVGNCSVNCGGGVLEKFRTCDSPTPSCGGKECSGMKVETMDCNEFSCDDEGTYARTYV